MLSQNAEQNATSSLRIEELLTGDLKETIEFHINKYGGTFDRKLGLTRDDLLNDMREQIWKGVLTHDPSKSANLKTYLNTFIKNRFKVLLKRSSIKKYNSIEYYGDVFASTGLDQEADAETCETIFEKRQIIMQDKARLNPIEALIYGDLLLGRTLDEMVEHNKLPRPKVVAAINRIDDMIRRRLRASNG